MHAPFSLSPLLISIADQLSLDNIAFLAHHICGPSITDDIQCISLVFINIRNERKQRVGCKAAFAAHQGPTGDYTLIIEIEFDGGHVVEMFDRAACEQIGRILAEE
jgi:hypothetical protein